MSQHWMPHSEVAAFAVPAVASPATPAPPTRVSDAAAANTLLFTDMKSPPALHVASEMKPTQLRSQGPVQHCSQILVLLCRAGVQVRPGELRSPGGAA